MNNVLTSGYGGCNQTGLTTPAPNQANIAALEQQIYNQEEHLWQLDSQVWQLQNQQINYTAGTVLDVNEIDCLNCQHFIQTLTLGANFCPNINCPATRNLSIYLTGKAVFNPSLKELYSTEEGLPVSESNEKLKQMLEVDKLDPSSRLEEIIESGWKQVKSIRSPCQPWLPGATLIPFYGACNNLLGWAVIRMVNGKKSVTTMTAWMHNASDQEHFFEVPFDKPYPLLNWNLIHDRSWLPVLLYPTVEQASHQQEQDTIATSFIDLVNTAADVNWDILKKRKVTFVLQPHSGLSMKQVYADAIPVVKHLKDVVGIDLTFQEKATVKPGECRMIW